jgi:hypothetical protein
VGKDVDGDALDQVEEKTIETHLRPFSSFQPQAFPCLLAAPADPTAAATPSVLISPSGPPPAASTAPPALTSAGNGSPPAAEIFCTSVDRSETRQRPSMPLSTRESPREMKTHLEEESLFYFGAEVVDDVHGSCTASRNLE